MNAEHNEMKEEILKIIRELEDSLMSSCDPYLWDAIRKIETRIKATNKGLNELALDYYQKNVEFFEEAYEKETIHKMAKRLTVGDLTGHIYEILDDLWEEENDD